MAVVWRRARKDFTFKGESYRAGQVFAVPPIVAVQMRNRVDKAKMPVPSAPVPETRRRGRRVTAPVVIAQPDPPEPEREIPAPAPLDPEPDALIHEAEPSDDEF